MALGEESKFFYVFGHPVLLSASPTIHITGFRINEFPHSYERFDTPSLDEVLRKLLLSSTGGGSITIPHKEGLVPHMDELTEAAQIIGAVNTVTRIATGLRGDNTDWIGIQRQLLPKLHRDGDRVGLILGAGGTARAAAYAFRPLFSTVYIVNRTMERAEELAREFGDAFIAVKDAECLMDLERLDAVMGTMPGPSNFTLPKGMLERHRPAVVEAAYKSSEAGSRFTALLQEAIDAGCKTVEGIEMLFEQGCAQCELWTGRSAPRAEIARALLKERFSDDEHPPPNLVFEAGLS